MAHQRNSASSAYDLISRIADARSTAKQRILAVTYG
jgi:hypothetical protein